MSNDYLIYWGLIKLAFQISSTLNLILKNILEKKQSATLSLAKRKTDL